MKKKIIAVAIGFGMVTGLPVSAASVPGEAERFGKLLDCSTQRALAYGSTTSELNRIKKAVDSCMSAAMSPQEQKVIKVEARSLKKLDRQREELVAAVQQRLDLCRTTGITEDRFSTACAQLFTLETVVKN